MNNPEKLQDEENTTYTTQYFVGHYNFLQITGGKDEANIVIMRKS
jgi:hypothetical protein